MTTQDEQGAETTPNYLWFNVAAGVIFALTAVLGAPLFGLEISPVLDNDQGQVTWLTTFIGVFLVGCLFWWLMMSWPRRFRLWRGAVVGVLVAFFSYPVVLLLTEFVQRGGDYTGTVTERFGNALLVTGLTLMTSGSAAIVTMALVGVLCALALMRLHAPTREIVRRNAERKRHPVLRFFQRAATVLAAFVALFLIGSFAWLSSIPLNTAGLAPVESDSVPSEDYDTAIAAYEAIRAKEAALPLHERCPTTMLTHGERVARVVIYFHGLTSCPAQADVLAQQMFDRGYNVLLPRMPGHGEADPMTEALADLRAEGMIDMANRSVDIAQGLGEEVVVVGLSAGGTLASWTAQYRSDVDTSISVSPFFGPYIVPPWATHAATNLLLMLPNIMVWWNPLEPVNPPDRDYAYPRYATHALAEVMRVGRVVDFSAKEKPAEANYLAMLLNAADVAVNNALAEQIVTAWRRNDRDVTVETLPFQRHLPHDIIDPRQQGGDIELVYPMIFEMMGDTE